MTVYPFAIDSDQTIIRVDDNITEVGGDSINQLRSAVFAIESQLGVSPAGTLSSLANFLNVSFNPNGTIKASALTSIGLATLPIVDNQVAFNAGIKEYKLALDFSTSNLHTAILANQALLNSLVTFTDSIFSDLHLHIAGATLLSDGSTSARHVLSHIDVNAVPTDPRDPAFHWSGLRDKTGVLRSATQAAQALQQINDDLTSHENSTSGAHVALGISVDTSQFLEIPATATDAQKVFNYLDEAEVLNMGQHRLTEHSNVVPRKAISQAFNLPDGYRENIIPPTSAMTFLVHSPNIGPVDDLSIGDDLIKFIPSNTNFVFDAQFSRVRIGDIVTVNYGNGIQVAFPIESFRYVPNSEWVVRINGVNLFDTDGYASAMARIDRPTFDTNTYGVLAIASANASGPSGPTPFSSILSSVIVGNPRGATALGLGFDPGQLDSTHYNLYLEFYPTGNPVDHVISMPAIDVTGNAGATPGSYTLDTVVSAINNNFRAIGYNYRFIAFSTLGQVGIMLADAINGAAFAIITGNNTSGTLVTGIYTNNVIGGNSLDNFDALGFGALGANVASPAYQGTWTSSIAAQTPTIVIPPLKNRDYIVNGQRKDSFAPTYLAHPDGYWDGYISARNPVGIFTVEVTYTINLDLNAAGLKPGKTIVVQPAIPFSNGLYNDVDYGRFIIKTVVFNTPCGGSTGSTNITVINGIHATGNGFGFSSLPNLPVRIYFGNDSVGFDSEEIIDQTPTATQYARFHEIYVDATGHTFSHERARLPRQTETTTQLNTFNVHFRDVSPKLRGYQGSNPLVFNKFVRLYILDYDVTSGSFDGYMGQPVGASAIISPGQVVTGRKNVPVRFYDETNVDYVEIVVTETSASPGVNLLSTAAPRYVDIELFPSLQPDQQHFYLGSCEVNWPPQTGQFIVQNVRDGRQFGSVSEVDFTSSALDFISAGDKYLHENGVIQGFALNSIGTGGEVFFNGGIALVNGRIVTANNAVVTIPQISNTLFSLPQTIQWAICVTQNGNLLPILLTATKQQFFATPSGGGNYYVQSVTLSELINTRKDLTLIAIATAVINSITISGVQDARRFVTSVGLNTALTWSSDRSILGHYYSFSALSSWLNNYNVGGGTHVTVRGNFTLNAPVDMTTLTGGGVVFDGLESTITVNSGQGFLLGSNVSLKNFTFSYNPTGLSYSTNSFGVNPDLINTGNGCIFLPSGLNHSGITIDGCSFTSTTGTSQRPPMIGGQLIGGQVNQNIVIKNCSFHDPVATSTQAAIAFVGLDNSTGTVNTMLNCTIANNVCDRDQGIYITSISSGHVMVNPGVNIIGTVIEGNNCGVIGFCNSSFVNTSALITVNNPIIGLLISKNTCRYIATVDHTAVSTILMTSTNFGTGNVKISGNFCNWIHVLAQDQTTNLNLSALNISQNTLRSYVIGFLTNPYLNGLTHDSNFGKSFNAGIIVYSGSATTSGASMYQVYDNTIGFGEVYGGILGTVTYGYDNGIFTVGSSDIRNNYISGLNTGANGIVFAGFVSPTPFRTFWIQHNRIFRGSTNITSYVNGNVF